MLCDGLIRLHRSNQLKPETHITSAFCFLNLMFIRLLICFAKLFIC
jgi:hypothetical protein